MKIHRTRKAKSVDNNPKDHLFIEVEKDRWLEIKYENPSHKAIHEMLRKEKKEHKFQIGFAERYFKVGGIKSWVESEPIK